MGTHGFVLLTVLLLMTLTHRLIQAGENEDSYIGCYRDVEYNRDLEDRVWRWRNTNTVEKCLEHCAVLGKKYAGLQNGYACMCGNNYGKHNEGVALAESQCNVACEGDPDTMCGGVLANSIYSTAAKQGEVDILEYLTEQIQRNDKEIQDLTSQLSTANTEIKQLTLDMSTQVAFSAVRDVSSNLETLSFGDTIVFNKALTNVGGGYNTGNGIFTCPVTGIYYIRYDIQVDYSDAATQLVHNSNKLTWSYYSDDSNWGYIGAGLVLQLTQGDTLKLTTVRDSQLRWKYLPWTHDQYSSMFSGYLLK